MFETKRRLRSETEKCKKKRTKTGINLVIMLLGEHLYCDARIDIQEETKRKERKGRKKKGTQIVVFSGNKR